MEPVIHIMEPTARSIYGHHFVYCERAAEFFFTHGYANQSYFAWEGGADQQLRERAAQAKFVFTFRYGRSFERNYGGEIVDADPLERVSIHRAKQSILQTIGGQTIEDENTLWRIRYDLDTVTSAYRLSEAEDQTVGQAVADIYDWREVLRVNFADKRNILFLPTGEYFILHGILRQIDGFKGVVEQIHIRLWNFLSLEKNGANLVDLAVELQHAAQQHGVAVFLYSEADWGCRRLAALSSMPVGYLDINSFSQVSVSVAAERAVARAKIPKPERLRVFFPGSFRQFPDKGLAFLRALLLQEPFPDNLHLVIQEPDFGALRLDREMVTSLPHVSVLQRILNDDDYQNEFKLADVICVPYDHVTWPDQYRGSGVILEAFLDAKPVVVTAKTPLASYAAEYQVNVVSGADDFLEFLQTFDYERQFLHAAENCRKYARTLASNPMLEKLPTPTRRPLLRLLRSETEPARTVERPPEKALSGPFSLDARRI